MINKSCKAWLKHSVNWILHSRSLNILLACSFSAGNEDRLKTGWYCFSSGVCALIALLPRSQYYLGGCLWGGSIPGLGEGLAWRDPTNSQILSGLQIGFMNCTLTKNTNQSRLQNAHPSFVPASVELKMSHVWSGPVWPAASHSALWNWNCSTKLTKYLYNTKRQHCYISPATTPRWELKHMQRKLNCDASLVDHFARCLRSN